MVACDSNSLVWHFHRTKSTEKSWRVEENIKAIAIEQDQLYVAFFFFDSSTACFMSLHIPWVVKKFGICPTNQLNQLRPTSQGPQPGPRLRLLVHVAYNGADLAQDIGPTKPCGQNDNGAPRKKGRDDVFRLLLVVVVVILFPFCCNEFLKGPLKRLFRGFRWCKKGFFLGLVIHPREPSFAGAGKS